MPLGVWKSFLQSLNVLRLWLVLLKIYKVLILKMKNGLLILTKNGLLVQLVFLNSGILFMDLMCLKMLSQEYLALLLLLYT